MAFEIPIHAVHNCIINPLPWNVDGTWEYDEIVIPMIGSHYMFKVVGYFHNCYYFKTVLADRGEILQLALKKEAAML